MNCAKWIVQVLQMLLDWRPGAIQRRGAVSDWISDPASTWDIDYGGAEEEAGIGRTWMVRGISMFIAGFAGLVLGQPAMAQELFFYPSQGQSQQQQNQDFGECHAWAIQQSGYNPMAQPAPPPQEASQGGLLRGGARGAAAGAVVGAITGNAGRGAAAGAAGGALIGGFRRNDQRRQQEATQRQYNQQQAAGRNSYNRAVAACMQGRGYGVS